MTILRLTCSQLSCSLRCDKLKVMLKLSDQIGTYRAGGGADFVPNAAFLNDHCPCVYMWGLFPSMLGLTGFNTWLRLPCCHGNHALSDNLDKHDFLTLSSLFFKNVPFPVRY